MVDIVAVGSVALDTIRTPFGYVERTLGGSACYFSAAASILGARVGIVGKVGNDFPKEHLDFLRSKNTDLSGLEISEGDTFVWKGEYGKDWNQAVTKETHLGVFADFHPRLPDAYLDASLVFLGNIHPQLQLEVLDQIRTLEFVACDSMNYWIQTELETLKKVLKRVNCLLINEGEVKLLTGANNIFEGGYEILSMGPDVLVIKRGEYGAVLLTREHTFLSSAYPVLKVVDPTGAGDSFAGGFMGYLSVSNEIDFEALKRAVVAGTIIAGFTVEAFSLDRLKNLSNREFEVRYDKYLEIVCISR